MVLRPFVVEPISDNAPVQAWDEIFRVQSSPVESCRFITQPEHARLAGEIAWAFRGDGHTLPEPIVRAVSLHDEGWTEHDDGALTGHRPPESFIHAAATEFIAAWTGSIAAAAADSGAGGIIVSRHFCRLAQHRLRMGRDTAGDMQRIREFVATELRRQAELNRGEAYKDRQLDRYTDVLQFCDIASLYACCGAQRTVELPQDFGSGAMRMRAAGTHIKIEPRVLSTVCAKLRAHGRNGQGETITVEFG